VTQMRRLVDGLLDLARLQAGQEPSFNRQPMDLVRLIRQMVGEQARHTDLCEFLFTSAESELVGNWDAARLERAVTNLLTNAIHYSPEGGQIRVQLTRAADPVGSWAVLEIADQGIGIPAADLPCIFDEFQRGSNLSPWMTGSGLGLTSARYIVEREGGTITATSELGRGACFVVRLPLVSS
jgi:signal transduction histidine kinase